MAMTYQKTKDLKNTEIKWAEKIPCDWNVLPIRACLIERKEKNRDGNTDNILSVMKDVGVIRYADKGNVGNKSSDRPESYKVVHKDDIVINSMNLVIGSVGIAGEAGVTSSVYIIYKGKKDVDVRYFNDLFRDKTFQGHLGTYGKGIMELRESIKPYDIKWQRVPVPPLKIQKRIADFLDKKTVTIDAVIEKKQKLIELLKEQRTAIITKAVTKGLDPKAKMKDSGVEWIGEIPEGWIVASPNGVFKVIRGNCGFNKGDLKDEGDFVALQYGKTYKVDEVNEDFQFYVDESFYKDDQVVKIEDTILISTSETIEDLGHSCYYNRKDLGLLGGEQMCLKPKESIIGKFLHYATHHFKIELNQYATGIKVYRFRVDDLKKINIVVPPINEQKRIVNFLDEKTSKIDKAIEVTIQQIKKLKEYRASLIYNAVTGKITI